MAGLAVIWVTVGRWLLRPHNLAMVVNAGSRLVKAGNKLVDQFPVKKKASDSTFQADSGQADSGPPSPDRQLGNVMRRLDAAENVLGEQARLMSSAARDLGDIARVLQSLTVRTNVAIALGIGALVIWSITCAFLIMRLR